MKIQTCGSASDPTSSPETLLRACFDAAIAAADPKRCLREYLPEPPRGRTLVLGAGKAAASMARVVECDWRGSLDGLVVTRYGHAEPCEYIRVIEAGHPLSDTQGHKASAQMLDMARGLNSDDLLLFLVSGGGSALLSLPAEGIAANEKQQVTSQLLRCGAAIDEINCVRKHLSRVKGGRLAEAAFPARVVTLAISDVAGDDPSVIASGPTVADESSLNDAQEVLRRYGIEQSPRVTQVLDDSMSETPDGSDGLFANSEYLTIARPIEGLRAAAKVARDAGVYPLILGDRIEGEAADVGLCHAGIVRSIKDEGVPVEAPVMVISGGETTVTVRGNGRGGRNVEFLLGAFSALQGISNIYGLAADTDGIDGVEENAGAYFTPADGRRAVAKDLSTKSFLANNDAYSFFRQLDRLIVTGPTRTNINDFRAILVDGCRISEAAD